MARSNQNPLEAVLVTGSDLKPEAVRLLESHGLTLVYTSDEPTHQAICELASQHQISGLIVRHGNIDKQVLTASSQLRVVANHGAGYDNVDADAAKHLGIPFYIARARNATSLAEHALTMILALHKNLLQFDHEVRAGNWTGPVMAPREFSAKTLGIIGFGATGRELARLATPFGGNIIAYDPISAENATSAQKVASIDELLAKSDVVSLHIPLTPETDCLINQEKLSRFKPGAMLINTSRGGVIDEVAVAAALQSGMLYGAGLDTFIEEPMSSIHPFPGLPNVLLSPHLGGVTTECLLRMSLSTAENVLCILRGMPENEGDRI